MPRIAVVPFIAALCLALGTLLHSVPAAAQPAASALEITGTLSYPQRIALPPDAQVRVTVEDVSRADAQAAIVGESIFGTEGRQVPLPFRVSVDAAGIDASHSYAVRATIHRGGTLLFTSTQRYLVLTRGAGKRADIVLQQVTVPGAKAAERRSDPALANRAWQLVEVGGTPATTAPNQRSIQLLLSERDGRFSGFGGCNALPGRYTLGPTPGSISLEPAATTPSTCPEPLATQERALIRALQTATVYRIAGDSLVLLDGEAVLARFAAATAK
jgi:putative lipoprotein